MNRSTRLTVVMSLGAMMLALSPIVAQAAIVIDQDQPQNNTLMANYGQTGIAQSFQPSFSNVAGAGFLLESGTGNGTITIDLYDALPNAGGNLLATGSTAGISGTFADVFFGVTNVTPGQTYFLVTTSTNNNMGIRGSTLNPYAGGQVFANAGFQPFPGFDYTFRSFSDNAVAVPETGSFVLIGLTLPLIGLIVRRRKV